MIRMNQYVFVLMYLCCIWFRCFQVDIFVLYFGLPVFMCCSDELVFVCCFQVDVFVLYFGGGSWPGDKSADQ